jgi:pimeloyl-ACP methyl ester carboxylesterase
VSLEVLPEPPGRYTTTSSGLRFHYHELAATIATDAGEEPGAGPSEPLEPAAAGAPVAARVPAVFLHGGGPGCTAWTDFGQVGRLFSRDRRCLLVDLLQYGKTDKPTIDGPMWDFHAREYTALLDAWGIERADFVCNSWGGGAALNLAATAPERVNRLAITGAMPVFYGPLAPLPERAARGRNARDAYYGGTGPSREKMRQLMARLEWFDATRIPELTIDMRYEQSISAEERQINDAPSRRGKTSLTAWERCAPRRCSAGACTTRSSPPTIR